MRPPECVLAFEAALFAGDLTAAIAYLSPDIVLAVNQTGDPGPLSSRDGTTPDPKAHWSLGRLIDGWQAIRDRGQKLHFEPRAFADLGNVVIHAGALTLLDEAQTHKPASGGEYAGIAARSELAFAHEVERGRSGSPLEESAVDVAAGSRTIIRLSGFWVFTLSESRIARIDLLAGDPDPLAEAIVQRQFETYERKDLDAFCSCFLPDHVAENVAHDPACDEGHRATLTLSAYNWNGDTVFTTNKALRAYYGAIFHRHPDNHAQLVRRLSAGQWVCDHEWIEREPGTRFECLVLYRVWQGHIVEMYFVRD